MKFGAKLNVSASKSATSPSCKTLQASLENDRNTTKQTSKIGL